MFVFGKEKSYIKRYIIIFIHIFVINILWNEGIVDNEYFNVYDIKKDSNFICVYDAKELEDI